MGFTALERMYVQLSTCAWESSKCWTTEAGWEFRFLFLNLRLLDGTMGDKVDYSILLTSTSIHCTLYPTQLVTSLVASFDVCPVPSQSPLSVLSILWILSIFSPHHPRSPLPWLMQARGCLLWEVSTSYWSKLRDIDVDRIVWKRSVERG